MMTISSFGAINQAQYFVNNALDDHRNFLRISERLITLSGGIVESKKIDEEIHEEEGLDASRYTSWDRNRMDDYVWKMDTISENRAHNTINVIIELSRTERYAWICKRKSECEDEPTLS